MNDLIHAVGFLQNAYTILLALALSEAFKQFVSDSDRKEIVWDRFPSLLAFLFLIFPFFHGMSRYLFKTYLNDSDIPFRDVVFYLMFDGFIFLCLAAFFFVMSRSLSSEHWRRFYGALLLLLVVDSIWIIVCLCRGIPLEVWLILNFVLAAFLIFKLRFEKANVSKDAQLLCAILTFMTGVLSYVFMEGFYFR